MIRNLTYNELASVLRSVFAPGKDEKDLTFLVDLPTARLSDTSWWLDRRRLCVEWFSMLQDHPGDWPFQAFNLAVYENVGSNNADLPDSVEIAYSSPARGENLTPGKASLVDLLARSSVVLAPTQLSATAPLKLLARTHGFRGATLPDFRRSMIPALRLDYEAVDARVQILKRRMDEAIGAMVVLRAAENLYRVHLDLRHRGGHASGGLIREPGVVANLPSGEAYIAPYEGELEGDPSTTSGQLPVQFGDEVVIFRIEENRAREVLTSGPESAVQREKLREEPAYGNIAELGVGVLGEWGISAVGSLLLDEKLGLHIAFGRSDHFGGATGPKSFKDPANVIHIDWVYVPSLQPLVTAHALTFEYRDGRTEPVIIANQIVI